MSLSGRRLFIGDHNQLPPFDAERIGAILADRPALKNAVAQTEAAIGSTFYEAGLEDLRRALDNDATLDRVSAMASRALEPFRTLVEDDAARRPLAGGVRKSVSSELLVQHRMDPAIAELISRCFYKDRLTTGEKRTAAAADKLPFSFGKPFPTSPFC